MINTTDSAGAPTLLRTLGLRSLVLFGLAYMTPMIVLGIFGVVAPPRRQGRRRRRT